jgi:bifunctional DNA-binding transcriptional regulator/antitoxin component of YhaV-PrlF toxin-antitoxin module
VGGVISCDIINLMKMTTISSGGQVSIPAEVRRRWQTRTLSVEDRGDALVLRPVPADPIGAALGSLAGPGPSSEEMWAETRSEEVKAEQRKWGPR